MNERDEILEALDIELYLDEQGIDFKRTSGSRGPQLNLRTCPVCGADKWKVFIGAETGLGNCFSGSCEARFNKWSFVKAHLGMDEYKTVLNHIRESVKGQGWRPKKTHAVAVDLSATLLPAHFPLPIQDCNLAYLEARGIPLATAVYFNFAYCEAGLHYYTNEKGEKCAQRFGGRLLIPVCDLDGKLVTFQGRDITGTADRKYLFPAQLPATGRYLYNGQNAGGATRAVLGEGALDVAALKLALDDTIETRDVVPLGSFGKHLSYGATDGSDQLAQFGRLRRAGLRDVTIIWDGEASALEAAIEAGKRLMEIGLRVRIGLMPKGKDPNEVPAAMVQEVYRRAELLTRASMVRLLLLNPYR